LIIASASDVASVTLSALWTFIHGMKKRMYPE
jgi:hypothetical protein